MSLSAGTPRDSHCSCRAKTYNLKLFRLPLGPELRLDPLPDRRETPGCRHNRIIIGLVSKGSV